MPEFELRWMLRDTDQINLDGPGMEWERVLQIRHREGPRGEDWWGEWKDIPVLDQRS